MEKYVNDLTEYVREYGRFSLAEKEFSDEDALVLAEFCYLKFDGIVGDYEDAPISLEAIEFHVNKEDLFQDKRYEKDNRALYDAMVESRRFGGLKAAYYANKISVDKLSQFSAVTVILDEAHTVVCFRGTDETMVGWQEDFAMALKKPIYGQKRSIKYLSEVAKLTTGPLYVTGHSKGGNLAFYASMMCSGKVLKRIEKIYNFDGPGFRPEFLAEQEFGRIADKAVKYVPKASPIGLFLDTPLVPKVIEAKGVGALQHNPYLWEIKDGKLVGTKPTEQHELMMKSMNEWILGLDDEKLPVFVSMLCWLLDATDASTTIEMQADLAKHTKALFKAGQEVDEEMKEMAHTFVKSYFELASGMVLEEFRERTDQVFAELKTMFEEFTKAADPEVRKATKAAKVAAKKAEKERKLREKMEKAREKAESRKYIVK